MSCDEGEDREVTNLNQLLDRISEVARDHERVSIDAIMDRVGRRSFGPLVLLAGVITLAPIIGDIPGMPTLMAILTLLVAVQLLLGRDRLWLPQWLLKRAIARRQVERSLPWLRRPARWVDRLLRPRLRRLANGRAIAGLCVVVALAMPVMELVPFSANGAGLALSALGLGLIAHDGLLSLLAFIVTIGTFGGIVYVLL